MKRALVATLLVVIILAAVTLRVVIAGELEIAASTSALLAGDPHEAAVRARAAALWYAPGAPHVRVAYDRLLALGAEAEKRQDKELALFAYRGVHTASRSTRWLVEPHAADAVRADQAIARIEATLPRPPDTALEPAQTIERRQLEALARDLGPRMDWVIVLAASFVAWAIGIAWILFRCLDESGKVAWGRARLPLVIAAAGAIGWGAALYFA